MFGCAGTAPTLTVQFTTRNLTVRIAKSTSREQTAMAVPKRRTSPSKQGHRRSHHHATPKQIQYCKRCNEAVLGHRVCPNCGWFQGRIVVEKKEAEGK